MEPPRSKADIDALLEILFRDMKERPNLRVYSILDCARREHLFQKLLDSGEEQTCLLQGSLPPDLEQAAPYLVRLQPASPFTRWLLEEGYGDSWGIHLTAPASLDWLQAHLRRLLMVKDPDGKTLYFRFYDPRVFRVFLPTCEAAELEQIFGQVHGFLVEDEGGEGLLAFGRREGVLLQRLIRPGKDQG